MDKFVRYGTFIDTMNTEAAIRTSIIINILQLFIMFVIYVNIRGIRKLKQEEHNGSKLRGL